MSNANSYLDRLIKNFAEAILDPILFVLAAIAFLVFLWGLVVFIWKADSDEARRTGTRHMLYGLIGLLIIASTWGIVNLIQQTVTTLGS